MSQTTILKCDCGCNEKITNPYQIGWFVISQMERPATNTDGPKLERDLHFSSLECMRKWVSEAVDVLPKLQKTASTLCPRGRISNQSKAQGLFV